MQQRLFARQWNQSRNETIPPLHPLIRRHLGCGVLLSRCYICGVHSLLGFGLYRIGEIVCFFIPYSASGSIWGRLCLQSRTVSDCLLLLITSEQPTFPEPATQPTNTKAPLPTRRRSRANSLVSCSVLPWIRC